MIVNKSLSDGGSSMWFGLLQAHQYWKLPFIHIRYSDIISHSALLSGIFHPLFFIISDHCGNKNREWDHEQKQAQNSFHLIHSNKLLNNIKLNEEQKNQHNIRIAIDIWRLLRPLIHPFFLQLHNCCWIFLHSLF